MPTFNWYKRISEGEALWRLRPCRAWGYVTQTRIAAQYVNQLLWFLGRELILDSTKPISKESLASFNIIHVWAVSKVQHDEHNVIETVFHRQWRSKVSMGPPAYLFLGPPILLNYNLTNLFFSHCRHSSISFSLTVWISAKISQHQLRHWILKCEGFSQILRLVVICYLLPP